MVIHTGIMLHWVFYILSTSVNIIKTLEFSIRLPIMMQAPSFPDFDSAIKKAINMLGGRVFPKLNWSSPKVRKKTIHCMICFNKAVGIFLVGLLI